MIMLSIQEGEFLIQPAGDSVIIANSYNFEPRVWWFMVHKAKSDRSISQFRILKYGGNRTICFLEATQQSNWKRLMNL